MAVIAMPTLVRWGYRLSFLIGGISIFMAIATVGGVGDSSGLRNLPYGEWNLPIWAFTTTAVGFFLIFIAYSLRTRRPGARRLIVAFWLTGLVVTAALYFVARREVGTPVAIGWTVANLAMSLPAIAIGAWYLFRKRNVVQYFDSLRPPSGAEA